MANLFCSKVDFLCCRFFVPIHDQSRTSIFLNGTRWLFYDLRDLYSLLDNIILFFVSLVLRQKKEEVRQADPINTMVPAVATEMHKLGFDQDIKEGADFPSFKIFLDMFYI